MQTFLPDQDYRKAVSFLDMRRLGKQRVETMQVLSALTGFRIDRESSQVERSSTRGWVNHPVAKMWRGRELELLSYQRVTCEEWTGRGYRDSCLEKSERIIGAWEASEFYRKQLSGKPSWLTEELVASHRAALLWKDFGWYGKFGWEETPAYDYVWPHECYPETLVYD